MSCTFDHGITVIPETPPPPRRSPAKKVRLCKSYEMKNGWIHCRWVTSYSDNIVHIHWIIISFRVPKPTKRCRVQESKPAVAKKLEFSEEFEVRPILNYIFTKILYPMPLEICEKSIQKGEKISLS